MDAETQSALFDWEEADRRLSEWLDAHPDQAAAVNEQTRRVHDELRRRVGSTFTVDELAAFHQSGGDWASEVLGHQPRARLIADAAFRTYARRASDYIGGRAFRG